MLSLMTSAYYCSHFDKFTDVLQNPSARRCVKEFTFAQLFYAFQMLFFPKYPSFFARALGILLDGIKSLPTDAKLNEGGTDPCTRQKQASKQASIKSYTRRLTGKMSRSIMSTRVVVNLIHTDHVFSAKEGGCVVSGQDNNLRYLSKVVSNNGYLLASEISSYAIHKSPTNRNRVFAWISSLRNALVRVEDMLQQDEEADRRRRGVE